MSLGSRRVLAVAALAAALGLSACSPPDGTLRVVGSCGRAGTIEVSVDSQVVGTVNGSGSADFPLEPGNHTVSALSRNGFTWNPRSVTITSGEVFTFNLICI